MIILLLSGWSHAGKDTAAKIFVESYDFYKYAFADPIKHLVAAEQDIPLEWCYDQVRKSQPLNEGTPTLRELLIQKGEDGRKKDKNIWANTIAQKILVRKHKRIIISDWRSLDELLALQKAIPGATIIPLQIVRPKQLISPVPDATEYGLLGFPFWRTIQNNGSLHRLVAQVCEFVEQDLPTIE
jgi:hypothetical protein